MRDAPQKFLTLFSASKTRARRAAKHFRDDFRNARALLTRKSRRKSVAARRARVFKTKIEPRICKTRSVGMGHPAHLSSHIRLRICPQGDFHLQRLTPATAIGCWVTTKRGGGAWRPRTTYRSSAGSGAASETTISGAPPTCPGGMVFSRRTQEPVWSDPPWGEWPTGSFGTNQGDNGFGGGYALQ